MGRARLALIAASIATLAGCTGAAARPDTHMSPQSADQGRRILAAPMPTPSSSPLVESPALTTTSTAAPSTRQSGRAVQDTNARQPGTPASVPAQIPSNAGNAPPAAPPGEDPPSIRTSAPPQAPAPAPARLSSQVPAPAPAPAQSDVYYANCDAARAAGVAPIPRGAPGYRSGLDRDNDGTACDPEAPARAATAETAPASPEAPAVAPTAETAPTSPSLTTPPPPDRSVAPPPLLTPPGGD